VSGQGFAVDPDQLTGTGSAVDSCAQQLSTALQGLQTTITSQNPWGADDPGTVFGMAYTMVLKTAMDVYASHVEQLGGAAQRLAQWAQSVQSVDEGQAGRFDQMAKFQQV
jgi:hypothetical protein